MKYFLMGAFATGFLLFGIALLYGAFGTFDISKIAAHLAPALPSQGRPADSQWVLISGGIIFMLIGLSFKASAVPFHFWAPDVYQGSPTQVTAFMASIVKTAAFAAFLRLFICFSGLEGVWGNLIWIMAGITILLGNITAVYQKSVKRMLAYSSISHAGYLMLAILAMNLLSKGAVLYYAAAYSVATIASFTILSIVEGNKVNEEHPVSFSDFTGLAKRNPLLAFAMTVSMLSLAGIPPLAGFFGKYYLFSATLQSGYVWIVLIAVLGSLIGVYYYFRVIIAMYSQVATPASEGNELAVSQAQKIVLIITVLLSLALGIFPELVIRLL
ncbi:MAG TPA: NADH-quinone oxidoreductase subunit N, partial [Bacteroidia bacterium]